MANIFFRADGTALSRVTATGPDTDASKCMTLATLEGITLSAGDKGYISDKGGIFNTRFLIPSSGSSGNPITFYGIGTPIIKGNGTHTLRISTKNYITINNIIFDGAFSYLTATTNLNVNGCVFKNGTNTLGNLYLDSNAAATVNNCNIHGGISYGIQANTSGVSLTLRNNLIYGNGNAGIRTVNGVTLDYDYNNITGNSSSPLTNLDLGTGAADGGHNQIQKTPKITHYKNDNVYFNWTMDDNWNSESGGADGRVFVTYASALSPYNIPMTFFVRTDGGDGSGMSAELISNLNALKAQGHEIATHTWSHTLMDRTTAFDITTTNANPTCNVDVANHRIVLSTTTPGNSVTLDWAGIVTIYSLQTAVLGKGWTITPKTSVQPTLLLSSLADSGGAKSVPYTTNIDKTANSPFYYNEIAYPRSLIQTAISSQPTTYAYPGNVRDAGAEAYLVAQGFLGARAQTSRALSSVNLYSVTSTDLLTYKGDGTEITIRQMANHYYTWARSTGAIMTFLVHHEGELSVNQSLWFVDELSKLGAQWTTFNDAVAAIKADHSTADNITYTKTYSDISDYNLIPQSPVINAGVNVGLTTDFKGNIIPLDTAPDMGIYEYYPSVFHNNSGGSSSVLRVSYVLSLGTGVFRK